jgi:hypothetical protein
LAIDPDWSTMKRKQVGQLRLISAVYGIGDSWASRGELLVIGCF